MKYIGDKVGCVLIALGAGMNPESPLIDRSDGNDLIWDDSGVSLPYRT